MSKGGYAVNRDIGFGAGYVISDAGDQSYEGIVDAYNNTGKAGCTSAGCNNSDGPADKPVEKFHEILAENFILQV